MTRIKLMLTILFICLALLFSCSSKNNQADAVGSFEAIETMVSAESNGKIMLFTIEEGDQVKAGEVVGSIDSTQLYLSKLQLLQNKKAVLSSRPDIHAQLEALQRELDNAISDKKRIEKLVAGEVASQKQLDDANSRIAVLQSRIEAQKSLLGTNTSAIDEQASVVNAQLAQVEDQLKKCRIINPIPGTVLATYVNPFEMTSVGRPLYKVANLDEIILRAYITSDQFVKIKIGQTVDVMVDDEKGGARKFSGTISWINNQAEFTPKTIQTKNERANLVYAIKVKVKNDGTLKIGMYGEVAFH